MLLQIDIHSNRPLYEQLRDQIVLGIAAGQLRAGDVLPSVRRLGADLGINLHTVNKAYAILRDEGYLVLDRRRGAVVTERVSDTPVYRTVLSFRLRLAAAEAHCHGLNENDFLTICSENYRAVTKERGTDHA